MSGKKLSDMTNEELWRLFPIALTAPKPCWAEDYAQMEQRLASLLTGLPARLYHVGSTAIKGIWAKDIVDVLAAFETEEAMDAAAARLTQDGFNLVYREDGRIFLNLGYTENGFADKVYHIHLRLNKDMDEVYFRDYMNAHPDAAKAYEALKLGLWKQYEFDRDGYTEAKTAFIRRHTEQAKNELELIRPAAKYADQVMAYKEAMLAAGDSLDGCAGLENCDTYASWADFENRLKARYGKDYVPSDVYLAVRKADDTVVGIIDYRRCLSDFLLRFGGNIGYSVHPGQRRRGYATQMLGLLLPLARAAGAERVLVTCDKENIASAKTILSNGGVLENEVRDTVGLSDSGIIQRYWIAL